MNKTGTTSIKKEFERIGLCVGVERKAELLYRSFFSGDYGPIVSYIESAEAFQDFPFSYPKFYEFLEQKYPKAKFILTVRSSSDAWYNSLVQFHSQRFGEGQVPDVNRLKNSNYVEKGWVWTSLSSTFDLKASEDPYARDKMVKVYERHNHVAREYFLDKSDKFLEIDLSSDGAYQRFCSFLKLNTKFKDFPWENKTQNFK